MDPRNTPILRARGFTAPAAGAPFTFRSDNAAALLLQSVRFQFTTDANAATRELNFNVSDGTNEWFRTTCGTTQTASQTREYSAFDGSSSGAATLPARIFDWPHGGLFVPVGHTITITWESVQAGDLFANIVMSMIEFPTGPARKMWPFPHFFTEESE